MGTSGRRSAVVEAADGTPITFHIHGTSGGPVVVLTNGIGTTENFWRFLVADLSREHTVVHWDYRGHGSTPAGELRRLLAAHPGRRSRPGDPAGDAAAAAPPVHIAFSMGVAVLLELYRHHPELVRAMALIAGAPDAPGTGTWLFRVPGSLAATRALVALATPMVPLLAPVVRAFLRSRLPYPVARMAGVLQPHAPREDIDEFLEGVASMDFTAYWRTLRALLGARGSDVLPRVTVPVLIVAAANDLLMPVEQVENMRRGLPHARYVLISEAGHAGLVEKGPEMARAVRELLGRVPA